MPKQSEHAFHYPPRVIVGHCPSCGGVVIQCNDYGVWEPAKCRCGWGEYYDPTKPDLVNKHRMQRDFVVEVAGINVRLPPPRPVETVNVTSEVL